MTFREMKPHMEKLPELPAHFTIGPWRWPYPDQCSCGQGSHMDAGHEDHEIKMHDAAHIDLVRPDNRQPDFIRISGSWVRERSADEVKAVIDVNLAIMEKQN